MSEHPISSCPAAERTWVRCAGYFSGEAHRGPCWIGCESGKIAAITAEAPPGGQVLETEWFAIPLLADTHAHFYMDPWPVKPAERTPPGGKPFAEEVEDAIQRARQALADGVGFVRDLGDPLGVNLEVRRRLSPETGTAPDMQVAGAAIHRPKKYGRFLGVARETVTQIKETIDQLIDRDDVDVVKLITTGIVNFEEKIVKQTPQFSLVELAELVDYAHARRRKVAAHCSGADGLEIAIAAGVDFIEHAYFITDAQLDCLITKGLYWTPTFSPVEVQARDAACGWSAAIIKNIEEILAQHRRSIARGVGQGARLLAGTDAGSPGVALGLGTRRELRCLEEAGLAPEKALNIATRESARACGSRRYTGEIAVGHPASFALYTQAPWESMCHLDSLQKVYSHGEEIALCQRPKS